MRLCEQLRQSVLELFRATFWPWLWHRWLKAASSSSHAPCLLFSMVRMRRIEGKSLHASQIESRFPIVAAYSLDLSSTEITVNWGPARV